mmetsp:Transcript_87252/g.247087  ORF Transcript_87252/g.247087 Transcript_87252/m.247087 type:complete len:280 (-) Transcript_87252:4-843(-)
MTPCGALEAKSPASSWPAIPDAAPTWCLVFTTSNGLFTVPAATPAANPAERSKPICLAFGAALPGPYGRSSSKTAKYAVECAKCFPTVAPRPLYNLPMPPLAMELTMSTSPVAFCPLVALSLCIAIFTTSNGVITTASQAPARPPANMVRPKGSGPPDPSPSMRRNTEFPANFSPLRGMTTARPGTKPRQRPTAPSAWWMLRKAPNVPENLSACATPCPWSCSLVLMTSRGCIRDSSTVAAVPAARNCLDILQPCRGERGEGGRGTGRCQSLLGVWQEG